MSIIVVSDLLNFSRAAFTLGGVSGTIVPIFRLFVNNHTPVCTDDLSAFTTASWSDYADTTLVPADWDLVFSGCAVVATYPEFTLNWNYGGQTIYGHVVYDYTSGTWLWAELWDTPFAVPATGGALTVDLSWVDQQCPGLGVEGEAEWQQITRKAVQLKRKNGRKRPTRYPVRPDPTQDGRTAPGSPHLPESVTP